MSRDDIVFFNVMEASGTILQARIVFDRHCFGVSPTSRRWIDADTMLIRRCVLGKVLEGWGGGTLKDSKAAHDTCPLFYGVYKRKRFSTLMKWKQIQLIFKFWSLSSWWDSVTGQRAGAMKRPFGRRLISIALMLLHIFSLIILPPYLYWSMFFNLFLVLLCFFLLFSVERVYAQRLAKRSTQYGIWTWIGMLVTDMFLLFMTGITW